MNREIEYFYLFYDRPGKSLVQLDLLSNYSEGIPCVNGDKFRLYGKYYREEEDFIKAVGEFNEKMFHKYYEKFKITPPYGLDCQLLRYSSGKREYNIYITAADRCFRFVYGLDTPPTFADFAYFRNIKPGVFDANYMMKLHGQLLNSVVFRVGYYRTKAVYITKCGDETFFSNVEKSRVRDGLYFLKVGQDIPNDYVFDYYNVDRGAINSILTVGTWTGKWPEDVEQTIYKIMMFINRTYIANANIDFRISEDFVTYRGENYLFKQSKKGTWFLSGNIENVLKMFDIDSIDSLRKIVNTYLGTKNRPGVFPECDSKEELIDLIKKIKDGKRKFKLSSIAIPRPIHYDGQPYPIDDDYRISFGEI